MVTQCIQVQYYGEVGGWIVCRDDVFGSEMFRVFTLVRQIIEFGLGGRMGYRRFRFGQ